MDAQERQSKHGRGNGGGGGGALCTLAIPGGPVWRPGLASAASYTPLVPTLYRVAREPELCGLPARETLVVPVCGGGATKLCTCTCKTETETSHAHADEFPAHANQFTSHSNEFTQCP